MNENNPDFKEWNKKLEVAGLPEELPPTKVPVLSSMILELLSQIDPDIGVSVEQFKELSTKSQNEILEDLKKQRDSAVSPMEIIKRFKVLVVKSGEFERMGSSESDKEYKPKPTEKEQAENEESEEHARRVVDNLFKNLELIIQEHKKNPKPKDKLVN